MKCRYGKKIDEKPRECIIRCPIESDNTSTIHKKRFTILKINNHAKITHIYF